MPATEVSSLPAATLWLADLLTGSAATVLAVVAVAMLGMMMLAGRLPVRRGVLTVLGCFILFSARGIASALIYTATEPARELSTTAAQPLPYRPAVPVPVPYDPYAGAAVPQQAPSQQPLQ